MPGLLHNHIAVVTGAGSGIGRATALCLLAEGYSVVRRWRFLVVGANNADQAEEFAARIRPEVPAGAVVSIEEVGPRRPYTVFELLAGSGL